MSGHSRTSRYKVITKPFMAPARRFLETASRRGDAPAYHVRDEKGWTPTSWKTYSEEVRQAARALVALGMKQGDVVCIFGFNRPEWVIMDLAAMMAGAAPAGIYFTSSGQDAAYIINHSQCEIVLAEKQEYFDKISQQRAKLNRLRHVVMMKGASAEDPLQMTWEKFLSLGEDRFDEEVERRLQATRPEDTGTLIYTSGTTGPPKAVELSHGSLAWTANAVPQVWKVFETDRLVSYLPLAHIAEQMITIHFPTVIGNSVYFTPSMQDLPRTLTEVRPDHFFGVPRVYEKMAFAAQQKLGAATGAKAKIAKWALQVGQDWTRKGEEGIRRGPKAFLSKVIASALVHKKAKRALGLDRVRRLSCGAAPIPEETLKFMAGLDLPIREVWGLSETCGSGTANLPGETRMGSVGRILPGLELKITPEGELCIKGPSVFSGYAKDKAATGDTLIDDWMHTGDIGRVDEDGFIYITGRKKDIIITSGGKNISPANIEMDLTGLPLVENAVVCGDRRPYLSTLIALNAAAVTQFAARNGFSLTDPKLQEAIRQELQTGIDAINQTHSRVEHIRRFVILPEPLSIENGDLTPTMKVKRASVISRYESLLDTLYKDEIAA